MDIIPVIDLMDGQVVHAKRGDRVNYQPIQSSLCISSAPHDIINGLLELYPFKRFYIADINAIQQRGNHAEIIRKIRYEYPTIEIWLDAAINNAESAAMWQQQSVQCVIGSESLADINAYHQIRKVVENSFPLSLDFNHEGFLGPVELLRDAYLWPEHVIAMTLNRVGSAAGPDMEKLHDLHTRHLHVYAAGGIRDIADLTTLASSGVAGALVATILHSGMLTNNEIDSIIRIN